MSEEGRLLLYGRLEPDGTVTPTDEPPTRPDPHGPVARKEWPLEDGHGAFLSTVFLWVAHYRFGPGGVPEECDWFETMLFVDGESVEESQIRYQTLKEAKKGHATMEKAGDKALRRWTGVCERFRLVQGVLLAVQELEAQ